MKRKSLFLFLVCILSVLMFSSCDARDAGSLKSLTRPYIAQYECTEATWGSEDILDQFEYVLINLVDKEKMELIYKQKNGEKKVIESNYNFNIDTRELTAEIGILGYSFNQSVKIEKGKFTISKPLGGKQLIMKFKAK